MNSFDQLEGLVLIKLILAHIITDFIAQPKAWVIHKQTKKGSSKYLYVHGLLTGLVAYLLVGKWTAWEIPLFITTTHTLIDYWKIKKEDNIQYFLLDQLAHFIVLVLCWAYLAGNINTSLSTCFEVLNNKKYLIALTGYAVIIWPMGFVISKATQSWREQLKDVDSLSEAGKWIGIFERVLILTFILHNQYTPIGFLIAAKSILRFGDKEEQQPRKQTEYVLIGTLMSFASALALGMVIRLLLKP